MRIFTLFLTFFVVQNAQSSSCKAPSIFPLGTTSVSCNATDPSGNVGVCAFDVTVRYVCQIKQNGKKKNFIFGFKLRVLLFLIFLIFFLFTTSSQQRSAVFVTEPIVTVNVPFGTSAVLQAQVRTLNFS